MNVIHLLGRIGDDPATKTLDSGATVTEFSLATSERWTDKQGNKQEKTEWHRVVFWGKGGEIVAKHLSKGDPVQITGSMIYEKWQDKDGNNRTTAKVKAQNFEFVPSSGTREVKASDPVTSQPQRAKEPATSDGIPF